MSERRTKIALERLDEGRGIVFRVESKRWMKTHRTELRIGERGLQATGDLGGYQRGSFCLPWERVTELHYGPLGRGAIDGLYAREGEWCSRCVLPWVSEAQAEQVIAAIADRYPHLRIHPDSALEAAVGEVIAQKTLVRQRWLPPLGRDVVVTSASGRV